MRPDKFKVWNKIEKRWEQNWCSVYICDNGDVFDDDFMSEADTPYLEIRSTRKKLEIVWFTGLADKNGKEIYELCEINNKYRVIYIPPKFVLQDIFNLDILDIKDGEYYEITREYSEIPKD